MSNNQHSTSEAGSESLAGPSATTSTSSQTSRSSSTLQSRSNSNRPQPIHTHSHNFQESTPRDRHNEDDGGRSDAGSTTKDGSNHTQDQAGDEKVNMKQVPGGLWLPAVKGTIGGIEKAISAEFRLTLSIVHQQLNPISTPTTPSQPPHSASSQSTLRAHAHYQEQYEPPTGARAAVFRADPTVKSCFLGLKVDARDEIARLFGVA
ncbi:hypothetical protein I317_00141 [Kwoniella heveanensis CBS 569]|nr:hypothetical protein I317_00141 [Kwoniella heveanensis CBS 569]